MHYAIQKQNYFAIDIFMRMLQSDDFYHHSFNIMDVLPEVLEANVPSLSAYLDSRLMQTATLANVKRGNFKPLQGKSY